MIKIKNKKKIFSCLVVILISLLLPIVISHGEESEKVENFTENLTNPFLYIKITSLILVIIVIFLLTKKDKIKKNRKNILFSLVVIPVVLSSLYLAGFTIYENIVSESKGPVHWHADYKIFVCDERKMLVDPKGIGNRIGTSTLHEHNDERIHIEGTLLKIEEASLGKYFAAIGGELENDHLVYRTDEGIVDVKNGDKCESREGKLKVYVNGKKIENHENYVIYPNSYVPPGDCIIILFDESNNDEIDILCESWEVKGLDYNFKRREVKIGGKTWR